MGIVDDVVDEVGEPFAVEVDACDLVDVEGERLDVDEVDREVVGAAEVDVARSGALVDVGSAAVVVGTVCGVVIDGAVGPVFAGAGAGRTLMYRVNVAKNMSVITTVERRRR